MMRMRSLAALALIGALAYCAEPTGNSGTPGFATVAVRASAPPSLSRFAPALVVEQLHVYVGRFVNDVFDTTASSTVPFAETSNQVRVSLSVPVPGVDTTGLYIEYQTATGLTLFVASSQIILGPGRTSSPNLVTPDYVGPGSDISFMSMNGDDTVVTAGSTVQLDVSAFTAAGAPVDQFYLTWSTDDERVTVSPRGLLRTRPNVTQQVRVTARTPTGVEASNLITAQGTEALAIAPDSVTLRPAEEQVFELTVGRNFDIGTTWSVGGVDGGNATLGTVDQNGVYTAPSSPMPNRETQVCVRNSNDATMKGCAKVRMPSGTAGNADVVMINDLNLFDDLSMAGAGNQQFVRNLIGSTGGGSRSLGNVVWSERGRNSRCVPPQDSFNECGDSAKREFFNTISQAGYQVASFDGQPADLIDIPSNVRAIIFWMPLLEFTVSEVNGLKRFAAQGGRIIFIGENLPYYTQLGLDVENKLLTDLGGAMRNRGDLIDCRDEFGVPDYYETPTRSLRTHPLTAGVASLRYVCASQVILSQDDRPLFFDLTNKKALGAVAEISLVPLPEPNFVRATLPRPLVVEPQQANSRGVRR
jgi:hypothetical protein